MQVITVILYGENIHITNLSGPKAISMADHVSYSPRPNQNNPMAYVKSRDELFPTNY